MDNILIKQQHLCNLLDALAVGAILISPQRRVLAVNRSAELMANISPAETIGKPCRDVFMDVLCGGECRLDQSAKTGPVFDRIEIELTDPKHEVRSLTKIIHPLIDENQKPVGCMEIFQDHSAFKDLIKRLWYEDRRLKIIMENLDTAVMTVDRGGHITFFNTAAEAVTGYNRGTVLGKSCTVLFAEKKDDNLNLLIQTIQDGTPRSTRETWLVTESGGNLPVRTNYSAMKNKDGRIVGGLVTLTDLSLKHQLDSAMTDRYSYFDLVGKDPVMQRLFEIVPVVAASNATVLVEGPTGTGKDLLAKVIHSASSRANRPLVKVNCAALPDNLLESEMFGYVKGAFTGADRDKPGRFQDADGGTLFLDEIGDMPLALQAKLLRVLEDGEFYPLGGRKLTRVDVRIISATNQGLDNLVEEKRFREDLFYRLNVMRLEMPPLNDRKMDIPLLISHILKRLAAAQNRSVPRISEDAMSMLLNYHYPGNVRELENILEHALIICRGQTIDCRHLPMALQRDLGIGLQPSPSENPPEVEGVLEYSEKTLLLKTLQKHQWHRGQSARALNMDRSTLWRKMKKYQIHP